MTAAILALTAALSGQPQSFQLGNVQPVPSCLDERIAADPLQRHAVQVALRRNPPDAPAWKINLYMQVILSGQTISGRARRTNYCPLCSGPRCSDESRVRPGVCAASRNIPMHSVLWLQTDGLLLVTDRGGAVRVGGGYTNPRENARVDAWQYRCGRTCQDGTVSLVPWALLVVGDGDSHRNSQRRPLGEIERGFCK